MGRITGLDAAYPLYMNTGNEGHLARTDAAFVDVIHTDGGILGFPNPLGHVDFYPNGGKSNQPGCNLENAFQRSFSRFINQYSKKNRNPFLAQTSVSSQHVFSSHSRVWPSSRVDVLRRVSDESFRVPGQPMREMAPGYQSGLWVDAPSVDGFRRGSQSEREILFEDERAATLREKRDGILTFWFWMNQTVIWHLSRELAFERDTDRTEVMKKEEEEERFCNEEKKNENCPVLLYEGKGRKCGDEVNVVRDELDRVSLLCDERLK